MLALYIVVGIILFVVLVLSIPVDMAFAFNTRSDVKATVRFGWLFGLVWKDVGRGEKRKPKKKPEKKRKRNLKPLLSVFRTRGLPRKFFVLVRQMLSCLDIRQLNADLRVGLDEPVDTGIMCSILWPALVSLDWFGPVRFRIEPAFEGPVFEANLYGEVRLFPIQLVGYLLWFVFSMTGLRLVKSAVIAWWR